jgi:hypothetical protein
MSSTQQIINYIYIMYLNGTTCFGRVIDHFLVARKHKTKIEMNG